MKPMRMNKPLLAPLLLLFISCSSVLVVKTQQVDQNFYARPGVTPAQLLRARGFLAEEHFITTQDGYILKLTRGTNPKINQGAGGLPDKVPILFMHALIAGPVSFLVNSFGAEPKDLSQFDLRGNSSGLAGEPSARNLPLLALNFGHEIWFLSRRGTPGSRRKVGNPNSMQPNVATPAERHNDTLPTIHLPWPLGRIYPQAFQTALGGLVSYGDFFKLFKFSFDRDFWNYSYDEQAQYDFPQTVNYVLNQTKREKLAVVGHSAGGAITLMSLCLYPELADKITSAILWGPAFGQGHRDASRLHAPLAPLLRYYIGSHFPAVLATPLQAMLGMICATGLTQRTLCETILIDPLFGPSGLEAPNYGEHSAAAFYGAATHEFVQLLQAARLGGLMHKFDYGRKRNMQIYGQPIPPAYDLTRIRLRDMSFYVGTTDILVSKEDVNVVLRRLTVPYKLRKMNARWFNHVGFLFHKDNAKLVMIPSLQDIQHVD